MPVADCYSKGTEYGHDSGLDRISGLLRSGGGARPLLPSNPQPGPLRGTHVSAWRTRLLSSFHGGIHGMCSRRETITGAGGGAPLFWLGFSPPFERGFHF